MRRDDSASEPRAHQPGAPARRRPLTLRLAALWAEAGRTTREAKREELALVRQLAELDAAHRQLAEQGMVMPHSPDAERRRRAHVELLQSAARDVEAELDAALASTVRLRQLARRQLITAGDAQRAVPPRVARRLDCFPWHPVPTILVASLAVFYVCQGPFPPDLRIAAVFLVCIAVAIRSWLLRLEFNGRWLRVNRRLLWMTIGGGRTIDLAGLEVSLTTDEKDDGDGGTRSEAPIVLSGEWRYLPLFHGTPRVETRRIAEQLRNWCAIAKRPV